MMTRGAYHGRHNFEYIRCETQDRRPGVGTRAVCKRWCRWGSFESPSFPFSGTGRRNSIVFRPFQRTPASVVSRCAPACHRKGVSNVHCGAISSQSSGIQALLTKTRSWSPKPQPAPTEVIHLLHSTVSVRLRASRRLSPSGGLCPTRIGLYGWITLAAR